jgi:hypothetical protein
VAQLDYVHSVLRLNYETLKGLISLASPSVAKTTLSETVLAHLCATTTEAGPPVGVFEGYVAHVKLGFLRLVH